MHEHEIIRIVINTLGAGACVPIGGALAGIERIGTNWLENEFRHFIVAFGGGVLVAAVALVLVPEGSRYLPGVFPSVPLFVAGGACFFLLEKFLGARHSEHPQFIAMLLDYIPESLALGGAFAVGSQAAPILAVFIGLQNLPEGFNAYKELISTPGSAKRCILGLMLMLVPIGPVLAIAGWALLSDHVELIGAVMLFAAGGILYLIFQDIAPQSRLRRHWAPPLGAVLGFALGLLGTDFTIGH